MSLLNSKWTLYFHKLNDNNWNFNSYIKLSEFNNLEDYTIISTLLKPIHIENGMFFIMREDIKPMWESEDNNKGGCISFKIYKKFIYDSWNQLTNFLIGEKILKNEKDILNVNGISISPKKQFSIIKIWFKIPEIKETTLLNNMNLFNYKDAIYKLHQ